MDRPGDFNVSSAAPAAAPGGEGTDRGPDEVPDEPRDPRGLEDADDDSDSSDGPDAYYYDFYASPPLLTLSLLSLSSYGEGSLAAAKTRLLAPSLLRAVRKLTNVRCSADPVWVHQVLCDAAPHLEEAQLQAPAVRHLEALERMPHLARLDVDYFAELPGDTRTMAQMTFRPPPPRHRGLRFLKVGFLPESTTASLLRAHNRTLEELWISVGTWRVPAKLLWEERKAAATAAGAEGADKEAAATARKPDDDWPNTCVDLPRLLAGGTAEAAPEATANAAVEAAVEDAAAAASWPNLKRIVLYRWLFQHDRTTCADQLDEVRVALPAVLVECYVCRHLPSYEF